MNSLVSQIRRGAVRRGDEGVALIFVLGICFVVTLLIVTLFAAVMQTQHTTRTHRNITSAQGAAEAGLSDAEYQLGQSSSSGSPNWSVLPGQWTQSTPHTETFGNNASYSTYITKEVVSGVPTGHLIIWSQGTFDHSTRTIRAVVEQSYPPALGYSMFAATGIDIHHHNSSWMSPQITTTSVHSNGYIDIDYSAEFTVDNMDAVGNITFQKGGGSDFGGSIPAAGYNWYDPLNGQCFPGGYVPGVAGSCTGTGTKNGVSYSGPASYSGNAMVAGEIHAGSVTLGSRGQVLPVAAGTQTADGGTLQASGGDITAGSANINGTNYTTAAAAASCSQCNKGASAGAGQVSGSLTVTPGYAPAAITFPSINYSTAYRPQAQAAGTAYSSASAFMTAITSNTSNFYNIGPDGTLTQWAKGQPYPGAILLSGIYDVTSGSLNLDYGTIQKGVQTATGMSGPAPVIIVQGALIVENGDLNLTTGLVVVGSDNPTNFLVAGTATTPVSVNSAKLLAGGTRAGLLAAGGQINANDYDTDSPWTASCNCYEPGKATPIYVRGLVYAAKWNGTTSIPQNQHWHNFDPKNLMVIYGAQAGADLHDCNNFSFTYDPIVQSVQGFSTGSVKVIDYQELGT